MIAPNKPLQKSKTVQVDAWDVIQVLKFEPCWTLDICVQSGIPNAGF
jgi:hypothetical protein